MRRLSSVLLVLMLVLTACSLRPIEETEEVVGQSVAQAPNQQNNLEVTDEPNFTIIESTEEPELNSSDDEIEIVDRTNSDSGDDGTTTQSSGGNGGTTSDGTTKSGGTTKGGQPTTGASNCTNQLQFVADISVPDGTNIQAGSTFTKTWRVRNAGTCTWNSYYTLRQTGGTKITFSSFSNPNIPYVAPGQTVDLSVSLRLSTSVANGQTYRADFNLFDSHGNSFPTNIFVLVHAVVYQPPPPTCTNAVTVVSYPSSITVQKGQQFNTTWTLRNDGTCIWQNYAFTRTGGDFLTVSYGTGAGLPVIYPGQTVQVTLPLIVPSNAGIQSGTATSYFRMQTSSGAFFGGTVTYSVTVQHAPPPCTNVYQITAVPNSMTVQRGQNFNAVWSIQNIGTCTWSGYSFLQVNSTGLHLQTGTTVTIPTTAPGDNVQVTVPMVVPQGAVINNSTASITFRVITNQSIQFGGDFTYSVTVQENPTCTNNFSVVNAPPSQTVDAGDAFSVSVTLQNTGTCNWSNYRLVQTANNGLQLNGVTQVLIPATNAGNQVSINVPLAVPALYLSNTASGTFRLQTGDSTSFGQELNYSVDVNQPVACTDNATVISIPTSQNVSPSDTFSINVTLGNTGDCDWSGYRVIQTANNGLQLNGVTGVNIPNTNSGNNVQVSIPLIVPANFGGNNGSITLTVVDDQNTTVGSTFNYVVTVIQPCTPSFSVVSVPASQTVNAGDTFSVNLTLNNNGTCDWAGYSLVQTANNGLQLNGTLSVAIPNTTTGNNAMFSVPLTVPANFGGNTASGSFRVQDDMGTQFGQTLTYSVNVNQPPPCTDSFSVVSVPTSQTVSPGQAFNVNVILNNNGSCDWTNYRLVSTAANGLQFNGVSNVSLAATSAGNNVSFSVPLLVPSGFTGETASATFRLQNADGVNFGQTLPYSVTVDQPVVACTYDAMYIEDTTVPDGTTVPKNTEFTKSWLVQNTGTCPWEDMALVLLPEYTTNIEVVSDGINAPYSIPVIQPNAQGNVSIQLSIPASTPNNAAAQARFRLQDSNGNLFGAILIIDALAGN